MNALGIGWRLMFLVGAGAVLTGVQILLAPAQHIQTSGMTLDEIRAVSPSLAGWALHASQEASFSLALIGVAISTVAVTAYRRGERWAWWLLAVLSLGYIAANVAIHLVFGDTSYFPLVFGELALALVGLGAPMRAFLAEPRVEPAAAR